MNNHASIKSPITQDFFNTCRRFSSQRDFRSLRWSSLLNLPYDHVSFYTFFLCQHVATLDRESQVVYLHHLSNVPRNATMAATSLTEDEISEVLDDVYVSSDEYLSYFFEQEALGSPEFIDKCASFHSALIDEAVDEDDIAYEYGEDISSVKVARLFASKMIDERKRTLH